MTTKKTEVALNYFFEPDKEKTWHVGKTWAFLNAEDDKTIIKVKIKNLGGNEKCSCYKWRRGHRLFATYTIEPIEFTFLDKIVRTRDNLEASFPKEGKKIKVENLTIVYKDLKNNFSNLDEIFQEDFEVKLRLKNNPNITNKTITGGCDYWLLKDEEYGGNRDKFTLELFSEYEIITPSGIISFPQLEWEDWENRELKDKWDDEVGKIENWYQKVEKNLSLISLNSLSQLVSSTNSNSLQVKIEGEAINLSQIIHSKYWEIRKLLVKEIKNNINEWKIEGEVVKNKNGRQHWVSGLEKRLGNGYYDNEIIEEWLKIKKRLINKKQKEKSPKKLISCLTRYQGSAPSDGYYLFISQDNKHIFEISQSHPTFIQNRPKQTWCQGNNIRFYKISWLEKEKEKKLFTPEDLIEVVEQKTKKDKKEKLTELEEPKWYQKPINYFWGIVIVVGIFILLFLGKKILGIRKS